MLTQEVIAERTAWDEGYAFGRAEARHDVVSIAETIVRQIITVCGQHGEFAFLGNGSPMLRSELLEIVNGILNDGKEGDSDGFAQ